jgi:hypothetical protein
MVLDRLKVTQKVKLKNGQVASSGSFLWMMFSAWMRAPMDLQARSWTWKPQMVVVGVELSPFVAVESLSVVV